MKEKMKEIFGAFVLIVCTILGFVFPVGAKYIILGLTIGGLYSWVKHWRDY